MSSYFFENIYIPAAQADNTGYCWTLHRFIACLHVLYTEVGLEIWPALAYQMGWAQESPNL